MVISDTAVQLNTSKQLEYHQQQFMFNPYFLDTSGASCIKLNLLSLQPKSLFERLTLAVTPYLEFYIQLNPVS